MTAQLSKLDYISHGDPRARLFDAGAREYYRTFSCRVNHPLACGCRNVTPPNYKRKRVGFADARIGVRSKLQVAAQSFPSCISVQTRGPADRHNAPTGPRLHGATHPITDSHDTNKTSIPAAAVTPKAFNANIGSSGLVAS